MWTWLSTRKKFCFCFRILAYKVQPAPGCCCLERCCGWLAFKRESLDVYGLAKCQTSAADLQVLSEWEHAWFFVPVEQRSCWQILQGCVCSLSYKTKIFFSTCRAHQPLTGWAGRATCWVWSLLSSWHSRSAVVHNPLLRELCSCIWIRGWGCLQNVIME